MLEFFPLYDNMTKIDALSTIELADYYVYLYYLDDSQFSEDEKLTLVSVRTYVSNLLYSDPIPEEYKTIADKDGNIPIGNGKYMDWVTYHLSKHPKWSIGDGMPKIH